MKVIGKGSCHIYAPEDDQIHSGSGEPDWQESFVIYFWDVERKVFAFLRVNQQPGHVPADTVHWIHVWTPTHVYRHVAAAPLGEGAIGDRFLSADGGRCRYEYDGRFNWTISDPEAGFTLRLSLDQDHPGIGPFMADDADYLVSQTNKHHIEASGRAIGDLTIAGETVALDGSAWRDHSWGKRDWSAVRAHRFFPALFGPDFGFFGLTFVGADGSKFKTASIIRGDTVQMTSDFDILAYMQSDAVTNAGGEVRLNLDGETLSLRYRPETSCGVSKIANFVIASTMCTVTMGERVGVGAAETSNNPLGGSDTDVCISPPSIDGNGLFEASAPAWRD